MFLPAGMFLPREDARAAERKQQEMEVQPLTPVGEDSASDPVTHPFSQAELIVNDHVLPEPFEGPVSLPIRGAGYSFTQRSEYESFT